MKRNQIIFLLIFAIALCPVCISAADTQGEAYAAFGTPEIDGAADEIWNTTNPYIIENVCGQASSEYKGFFKALWDNENIYILAKIYTDGYSDTARDVSGRDSVEFFISENGGSAEVYANGDYRISTDFGGEVFVENYDGNLQCKTSLFSGGFIAEIGVPLKTKVLSDEAKLGFAIRANAAETPDSAQTSYVWGTAGDAADRLYSSLEGVGILTLKNTVDITEFNEPIYKAHKNADKGECVPIDDVITTFDGRESGYPILHIEEYPAMAIENLAKVIGGSVNGTTLTKDGKSLTFTEGSRLAEDSSGHILLERAPKMWDGSLYVPISFIVPYLKYNMQYNRFAKRLEITTGTNYPQTAEKIFYAKDFGAAGDGVTDDGGAITKALNAAMNSGVPSRVELEAGKTYLIGERMDSWNYFTIEEAENLTFEGNGSTILFEKPTNSFICIANSKNVKVRNMDIDYKELCATQGKIISVDKAAGTFRLEIDEGYPLPADDEWVHYFLTDSRSGGWWFGQLYDSQEDRMKYTDVDNLFIDEVEPVPDRVYELTVRGGATGNIKYAETGDRFVLNTRFSAYDISDTERKGGSTSAIYMNRCSDIEIDGVYVYSTGWMFCGIGFSEGKTTFKNSGFKVKDGRLLCANSDGIHTWFNRGALVLENCTFMNNLDDHFNTYTQGGFVNKQIDTRTFQTEVEINGRQGDEVQVYNPSTKTYLGRAFIKAAEYDGNGGQIITLDRDFYTVQTQEDGYTSPTLIYNMDSASRGNSVTGCRFINSRRYAILNRAANSIFQDNEINGCGAGLAAMNELTSATKSEGGFPSTTTFRNNTITGMGNTYKYYPIEVRHWRAAADSSRAIDGILIEGNSIDVPNSLGAIYIDSVSDLYMINNTVKSDSKIRTATCPVKIVNCGVSMIDGLTVDYSDKVNCAMEIIGSSVDDGNIKNVSDVNSNVGQKYRINQYEHLTEDFESASAESILDKYMTAYQTEYSDLSISCETDDSRNSKVLKLKRTSDGTDKDSAYDNVILRLDLTDKANLRESSGRLYLQFDFKTAAYNGMRIDIIDKNYIKRVFMNVKPIDGNTSEINAVLGEDDDNNAVVRKLSEFTPGKWHNLKCVVNYAKQCIEYYLDSEYIGVMNFSEMQNVPQGAVGLFEIVSWNQADRTYLYDNFDIWYEECAKIKEIYCINKDGERLANDSAADAAAGIVVKFNTDMNEASLKKAAVLTANDGEVCINGEYDAQTNTYIITPKNGEEYFNADTMYTLSISKEAVSKDGYELENAEDFTFETAKGYTQVNNLAVSISENVYSEVNIKADVVSTVSDDDGAEIIFCGYKDKVLVYASIWNVPVTAGNMHLEKRFSVFENVEIDDLKVFAWDSGGIVPLCIPAGIK